MYALVVFMPLLLALTFVHAKMPPAIAPQIDILKSVISDYRHQSTKFTFLNIKIEYIMSNECYLQNKVTSANLTQCILIINRMILEIDDLLRSILFIQENFKNIPIVFNDLRVTLDEDLSWKKKWLEKISKQLKFKVEVLSEGLKKSIQFEVDLKLKDIISKARVEAICNSFQSNLSILQKLDLYFDSIQANFAQYERLRLQLSITVLKMRFLEGNCVTPDKLKAAEDLLVTLTKKTDSKAFNDFKNSVCSMNSLEKLSIKECLSLPKTPESVSLLESIVDKKGAPL